jgi:Mrp family chromosome partitioning ATPase/polyhydroxyalkanoate synthesis regulator phasin
MRQKVEDAEGKVEDFRAKSNLLIGVNNTTLSAQQLGDINTQLAAARTLKADAEARAAVIRDMLRSGQPLESSDILNSDLIRRLAEQRVTLRAQLAEQSSTLLDNHPRIKELKAQIADLDKQIRIEADTLARSLENNAKLATARVESQLAIFDQLKRQAATGNVDDVQLRALERDAKSQRDLLESYLAKYREATSRDTINSTPAEARIISRATVSNIPAFPKKLPTVLIATFATLVLSSGLLMTKEILAAPAGFVPLRGGLGTLVAGGLAPNVTFFSADRRGEPRLVDGVPAKSVMDVVHSLRRSGQSAGRIAVFGATPSINTSQTAVRLARALAEESRVILVGLASGDTAIRGISREPTAGGLAELARGQASFGTIITKDKLSPLHLIAAGQVADQGQGGWIELLSASGMALNFDALARSYDYVVVDAGTVSGPELAPVAEIAPYAVVAADTTTSPAAASARQTLSAAGFSDVTVLGPYGSPLEAAAAA